MVNDKHNICNNPDTSFKPNKACIFKKLEKYKSTEKEIKENIKKYFSKEEYEIYLSSLISKEEKEKMMREEHEFNNYINSIPNKRKNIIYKNTNNINVYDTSPSISSSVTPTFGGNNVTPDPEYVHGILNGSGPVTINGYGIEINGESL